MNELIKYENVKRDIVAPQYQELGAVLGTGERGLNRFCRIAVTAIQDNPKLLLCNHMSLRLSVMHCAMMQLEPSMGQVAIVPRGGVARAELMYQGMIELLLDTGKITKVWAAIAYEGDMFTHVLGTDPRIEHEPADVTTDKWTHAYAVAKLIDGDTQFVAMRYDEVMVIKDKTPASMKGARTPWNTDEGEMAKKTAIRRLWKILPKTKRAAAAQQIDMQNELGTYEPTLPAQAEVHAPMPDTGSIDPDRIDVIQRIVEFERELREQPGGEDDIQAARESAGVEMTADLHKAAQADLEELAQAYQVAP